MRRENQVAYPVALPELRECRLIIAAKYVELLMRGERLVSAIDLRLIVKVDETRSPGGYVAPANAMSAQDSPNIDEVRPVAYPLRCRPG